MDFLNYLTGCDVLSIKRIDVHVEIKSILYQFRMLFRDILPYDETRVRLRGSATGDYINASYVNMEVPGMGIINRYIAAQGPLPNTTADFWTMVWQQQCTLVIMLTTQVERGRVKCHQYWPNLNDTMPIGDTLRLTCTKEEDNGVIAYREFTLVHKEVGTLVTLSTYLTPMLYNNYYCR